MMKDVKKHTINQREIPNFYHKSHKIPRFSHEVTMVLHGNGMEITRKHMELLHQQLLQKMRKTYQNTKNNLSY